MIVELDYSVVGHWSSETEVMGQLFKLVIWSLKAFSERVVDIFSKFVIPEAGR